MEIAQKKNMKTVLIIHVFHATVSLTDFISKADVNYEVMTIIVSKIFSICQDVVRTPYPYDFAMSVKYY